MTIANVAISLSTKKNILATETQAAFDEVIATCRHTFYNKARDYGTSWRVYRPISVADQIYIKLKRIRTIQEKQEQKIGDDVRSEFEGIINYAVIGLIQLQLPTPDVIDVPVHEVMHWYDAQVSTAKALMLDKNHDYGEAWREMSQESLTDLSLAKTLRIRQIVANNGTTIASEGIGANFQDILNYAVFALILMQKGVHKS